MVQKSRIFMAFLILEMDDSRDSNVRSLADFATRSSSDESIFVFCFILFQQLKLVI